MKITDLIPRVLFEQAESVGRAIDTLYTLLEKSEYSYSDDIIEHRL